jgi:hypothetical protein
MEAIKEFEIWIEGYAATGEHQKAHLIGKAKGKTFEEACINFRYPEDIENMWGTIIVKKGTPLKLDKDPDQPDGFRRMSKGNLCIWGCALFDNETDARKAFG